MRELMAVDELIDAVLASIVVHRPGAVDTVRVRRGSTFSEDALRRGFDALVVGTPIEGARLEVETVSRIVVCACGRCPTIDAGDLIGQVWICAICGHSEEIDERDDLELIEVRLAHEGVVASSAGSR